MSLLLLPILGVAYLTHFHICSCWFPAILSFLQGEPRWENSHDTTWAQTCNLRTTKPRASGYWGPCVRVCGFCVCILLCTSCTKTEHIYCTNLAVNLFLILKCATVCNTENFTTNLPTGYFQSPVPMTGPYQVGTRVHPGQYFVLLPKSNL